MIDVIKQMFSMIWTFVLRKSYENRDISAEYMPAISQKSAVMPIE